MINNLTIIEKFIHESGEHLYDLIVIKRKKDSPDNQGKVIKRFFIHNNDELYRTMPEIVNLCEMNKARAYINLNSKSLERILKMMNMLIASKIYNNDYSGIENIFYSAVGQVKASRGEQTWVVDLDTKDKKYIDNVAEYINTKLRPANVYNKVLAKIPTKKGVHLITTPFDISWFKTEFPDIDVQKNNPTLLYLPDSLT